MENLDEHNPLHEQLWRRYVRESACKSAAHPPLEDLAAYLDRGLEAEQRSRMEAHLSACPECLEAVLTAQHSNETAGFLVPQHVLDAAKTLVARPDVTTQAAPMSDAIDRIRWLFLARRAGLVAAGIAVCLLGYQVGSVLPARLSRADPNLIADASFGLFEQTADAELELGPYPFSVEAEDQQ